MNYLKIIPKKIKNYYYKPNKGFAIIERNSETGKTVKYLGIYETREQAEDQIKVLKEHY